MSNDRCFICDDRTDGEQEGFSADLVLLPGLECPVLVCGNCILRAERRAE